MTQRHIYLNMTSLSDAQTIFFDQFNWNQWPQETLPSVDSVGRVLSEPVFAQYSSPNYHAAAMDGIAVRAEDTFGINANRPKKLLVNNNAFYVNTGHVLPPQTNAVIMIEDIQIIDDSTIIIEAPAVPWQHVRKMGEDMVATEMLFPRNHCITPYCLGALLAGGVFTVHVNKKPRIGIIPTGNEIINWNDKQASSLPPGYVIESNSHVLGSLVIQAGGEVTTFEKLPDHVKVIQDTVNHMMQQEDIDIGIIIGGSSAGAEDYTRQVVQLCGEVLVHGVTIMPGKPVVLGKVNNKPMIGVPGYPVSAIIVFEQFIAPLIRNMTGQLEEKRKILQVITGRKIASKLGVEEFLRVKLGRVGDHIIATPLPRGAGTITSLTRADGIIRIPTHVEGINSNEIVNAELIRPKETLDKTIVAVGSHDNCLDLLSDHIRQFDKHLSLASNHVGSMGGIMAIKKQLCHIAGIHLLDTTDGSYNVSYIKRYLPHMAVKLINLVVRDQGLMVLPGNPKNIKGIQDLANKDIMFINRQNGSGTRILLDYQLERLGIQSDDIQGYNTEEFTHMTIAASVYSRSADVGLGILSAAKSLGLDFIPVVKEQYDLIIPEPIFQTDFIQTLIQTIRSDSFKKRVISLGGYSTHLTGVEINCFKSDENL